MGVDTELFRSQVEVGRAAVEGGYDVENSQHGLKSELALLRRAPLIRAGNIGVRRPKSIFSLKSAAKLRWVELRGGVLLICSSEHQRGDVIHVESLDGASVIRKDSTRLIINPSSKNTEFRRVELTFSSSSELEEWRSSLDVLVSQHSAELSDFEMVSPIGKGGAGKVFLVRHKNTRKLYAMKVIQKFGVLESESSIRHAVDERYILELAQGVPFLLQLEHAFQTSQNLYLVCEFCSGGDLNRYLQHSDKHRVSEETAKLILAEVIIALEYLHKKGIVYRDLKPENILIDNEGHVKIADFGLSKILPGGRFGRTDSFCGTREYVSPEVIRGRDYGQRVDLWSLGILMYRLVCGYTPFYSPQQTRYELFHKIQDDDVKFPGRVSPAFRELITGLLKKDEDQRMTLEEVKSDLVFENIDWNLVAEKKYQWCVDMEISESDQYEIPADLIKNFKVDQLHMNVDEMRDESANSKQNFQLVRGLIPGVLKRDHSKQSLIAGYSFSSTSSSGNVASYSLENI
mmetsp:Transcript_3396/g.5951  ORF Transcript_3396/g.5951 Transcript_3396/m.5951 type:complete len:516 (-) Transcript_3396:52-1599(-)